MNGIVLAAGGGSRLKPLTDDRPKTLLAVEGERTILELCIENLAVAGVDAVVVVTGHRASMIDAVAPELAHRYSVPITTRFNPEYASMNNAYSLWICRDDWMNGALVVNGDTVHPAEVEQRLLAAPAAPVTLAIDHAKPLGAEEMKVIVATDAHLLSIGKAMPADLAHGEYIGVLRLGVEGTGALVTALERTFGLDPDRWYEDGFQEFVDSGGHVSTVPVDGVRWIEVDDHDDLARARALLEQPAPPQG